MANKLTTVRKTSLLSKCEMKQKLTFKVPHKAITMKPKRNLWNWDKFPYAILFLCNVCPLSKFTTKLNSVYMGLAQLSLLSLQVWLQFLPLLLCKFAYCDKHMILPERRKRWGLPIVDTQNWQKPTQAGKNLTQQVFRSLVFYAWLFGCLSHSAKHRALVFPNASHFKRCHALLCDRLICITCLSTIHLDGKLERSLVSLFSLLYVLLFSSILTDLYRSLKALVDPTIWGGEWPQAIIDWTKRWHYLVHRTIFEQISGGDGM
jgi:hypothetical protein